MKQSCLYYFLFSVQSKLVSTKTPAPFISIAQEISTCNITRPFVIDLYSIFNVCTSWTLQYAMSLSFISNSALLMNATSFSKSHPCMSPGIRHAVGFNLKAFDT